MRVLGKGMLLFDPLGQGESDLGVVELLDNRSSAFGCWNFLYSDDLTK
jgi:hypothetical protein